MARLESYSKRLTHVLRLLIPIALVLGPAQPPTAGAASVPAPKSFNVVPGKAATLSHAGATLTIGADAVAAPMTITIQPLSDADVVNGKQGMANTTAGAQRGYRFLPHNTHFKSNIRITLPYDKQLIQAGLTDQDVNTFFFDEDSGSWQQLERVSVDTVAGTVTSLTDHFTDFINATVAVPDHPEPLSLNPNSIKDIKAANPATGVGLISPPRVSNTGDANLAYPIDLPPGRLGMQPRLQIGYSSSGGNGWLGAGWDLSVPSLSIDTRWGVPRYDELKETETYTLSGEQLTPLAHRSAPVDRTADKVFGTRVETQFARIVRHGTGPKNYTWEVTDKNGVRSFFGGHPDQGPDANATLEDDSGNIFRWALIETRDLHGNGVRYAYDLVTDEGVAGGVVDGRQLYLREINYTTSNGAPGAYTVTLRRASEPRRPDVQIDARGGFKMVTAALLERIEVKFNGQPVRSYHLAYQEGAFKKTLLRSITQRGDDGSALPPHEFSYFDEVRTGATAYNGFAPQEAWNTGADSVNWTTKTGSPADALVGPLGEFIGFGGATALSGSVSDSLGGHIYVGFNPEAPTKQSSAGGKVGFNASENDTLLLLQDINGDQLPDKLFRNQSGAVYFRSNESGPDGTTVFGPATPIPTLNVLSKESSNSYSFGGEAYFLVNGLINDAETFTTGSVYFSDVNGDGLQDLVNGGTVLFNHLENGTPTFTANSADSPVPIAPLAIDGTGIVEDLRPIYEKAVDTFPLHDTLRRWVAPFSGTISITGDVRLIQDASPARAQYTTADGVRVAIQHNGAELFSQTIAATDYAPKSPQNVGNVAVNAGDRIYFRVGSVFDGKFDQVAWDPVITYQSVPAAVDVNGLDVYKYTASSDFTLAGRRAISVQMPFDGTVRMAGALTKSGPTTDDVKLLVLKNDQPVLSETKAWNQTGSFGLPADFTVAKDDVIKLRVQVDSPIDVGKLQWNPDLFYISVTDPQGQVVQDGQGNYLIQLNPPYDIDLYPATNLLAPQPAYVATQDGVLTVQTLLGATDSTNSGFVTFTIKKRGVLLGKATLSVTNGVVANAQLSVTVKQGDQLFFDYSVYDPTLASKLVTPNVRASFGTPGTDPTFDVPSALHSATLPGLFPQAHRGWTVAGYNGNRDRATAPIVESDLNAQFDKQSTYDPRTAKAYLFYSVPDKSIWRGPDDLGYIAKDAISSSRLGVDFISVPDPDSVSGSQAVSKLSRTSQLTKGFGASVPPLSASGSKSDGTSHAGIDYIDLNGDQFPDVIGNGRVQYTTPLGGLEAKNRTVPDLGRVRESDNNATNVGVGGSAAFSVGGSDGKVDTTPARAPREAGTGSQFVTLGLGGSLGSGDSTVQFDLMDVNGDGLPDRITRNGVAGTCAATLCVAFNLGYRFGAYEPWGDAPLGDGASSNFALNGSLGFNGGIYDFAGGLSLDKNASHGHCSSVTPTGTCSTGKDSLLDVNGDGLPDRVRADSTSLRVAFNTGNGFAPEATWSGALGEGIARSGQTGLGAGVYFTIGIGPLCLVGCYIIVNPGVDYARSLARVESVVRDADGDGYPDQLVSSNDGSLVVARNRTGKTNLLQSMKRPLGAVVNLDYERAGNTYDLPQSRWVLATVATTDGVPGDGVDTQVTTFRYENGRYDRREREFYGFGKVTEEHRDASHNGALYRSVLREYRVDSSYTRGLATRELTRDSAGRPFVETVNTYRFRDVEGGSEPADPSGLLQSLSARVFPQLARTDRRFYEGQAAAGKATHTTNEYDVVGNLSEQFDAGDAGAGDDVLASVDYSQSLVACRTNHIVGKPTRIVVTASGGAVMRHREASVDCTKGNVTEVRQFLADGAAAITNLTYLGNGNLHAAQGPVNLNGDRSLLTYEYDPVVQTHVAEVRDNLGYVSSATYDPNFGAIQSSVDVNNNRTSYVYDAFGRVASITGPYEQGGAAPTIRFDYHPDAPVPWARTRHYDRLRDPSGGDTIDTVLFADGLGRVLQTKKDASVFAGPESGTQDVMTVSGRLTFDFVGRTVQQRYPRTEPLGSAGAFNATPDPVSPTVTEYDILDRATRLTIPDGTSTTSSYGFGADRTGAVQFETTVTDANGVQMKTYRDVQDLITSIKELNQKGQQTIWTSYGYDALQQITEVKDDKNNLTSVIYDNLGRQTIVDNPDTGRTETVYDLASNVVARVTPNLRAAGKRVAYDYDEINRLVSIMHPSFPDTNVSYTYGGPGAGANRAGRITRVTEQSGSEERFYGKLGELTKEVKTIVGFTGNSPFTYMTEYVSDTLGRLQTLTYPDGEVLTYEYDAGGLVRRATGRKGTFTYPYVTRLEYDKFEQRAFVEDGNGVRTQVSYRPDNRRLDNLRAGKAGLTPIQNVKYQYDRVGNVVRLANEVAVPGPSSFGGPTVETFTYDDLYRLTSSAGTYQFAPNKTNQYKLDMTYDSIHNVLSKTQKHEIVQPSTVPVTQHKTTYDFDYAYQPAHPHAPTHIGDRTFTYDPNGNQTGWTNDLNGTRRTIVWDDVNRVRSIFDNGHEKTYKYDDAGQRVVKRGPQGETVYANQYFTMRNGSIGTKHVYAGSARMVSKLVKSNVFEKDQYFYHPDHLGSSSYVTDLNGALYEHVEYFPFGETRVEENSNTQRTPYLFTGKELDEETDLYYYGARYYDPRTSVWQSPDPILEKYLPAAGGRGDGLPGMGGVFNSRNLGLFTYSHNNPVRLVDPDGTDARVTVNGDTVTISAIIYIYGPGANTAVARDYKDGIIGAWDMGWTYRHTPSGGGRAKTLNVKFDVDVRLFNPSDASAVTPSDLSNYIRVEDKGITLPGGDGWSLENTSVVNSGNKGVWRGKPVKAASLLEDNPAPHEFGHLLGLNDRKTDRGQPHPGWEMNVMGDLHMPAEQRNINAVLSNALKDYTGQKQYTTRIANKNMDW